MAKPIAPRRLVAVSVLVFAAGLLPGRMAHALISGATANNSGSTCSGGNNADGFCGSSTQILTNNGTNLNTRYAWNVNADVIILSTRDESGTAQHHVNFTATAVGGYRLDINTTRAGMVQRNSDAVNCDGQAHMSAVTGSSNIALNSGTLNIAGSVDVNNGTGDNQQAFGGSSGTAQIFRVSNGAGQSHALTFSWNGSVRSNSCEAAVRMGQQNGSTSGCGACEYPGSPSRTQSSDGHFVNVTFTNLCGNGTIDGSVGEACDQGSANGAFSSCCTTTCQFRSAGQVCRSSAGVCDPQETCTGSNANCPNDTLSSSSTVCRPSAGVCDVAENCTGSAPNCPPDLFASAFTECRAAAGVCDLAENCTGSSAACPPDVFRSSSFQCRASAGVCDVAENCTGSGPNCPADGFASSSTVCRVSAGVCDVAENCTGSSAACPANGFASSSTLCRASAGACDVAENCTGSSAACPADGFASSSTVCRAAADVCDVAENCTGSSASCPADSVAGAFVGCRPAAGDCDAAENCDGVSTACPPDAFQPSTVECRAAAGDCDVAENCTGSSASCPADAVQPSSFECRASAGVCDVAENCDGSTANCPADGFEPSSVVCRPAAGVCDLADNCTGSSAACPTDSVAGAFVQCRPSAGPCDVAENCDGVGVDCPADGFASSSTVCRASAGVCDVAENCDGSSAACPADVKSTAVCRAAAGTCDVAESCDGASDTCPPDGFAPALTTCRAAADTCDVAEVCTGLSATCPPDVTAPDGTPCDDNSSCSTADECAGGVCVGTPDPDGCADDFLCYKVKGSFTPVPNVRLVDQFEDVFVDVRKLRNLCTPADKNSEGVFDDTTHLVAYMITGSPGTPKFIRRTNLLVENQLGSLRVDAYKRDLLLVPSNKSLTGPTTPPSIPSINVDHYKCYKAKTTAGTPRFVPTTVTVTDQFIGVTPKTYTLKKLRHLCTPVDKNGEGIKNADAHLACYLAKAASGQPRHVRQTGVNTNNQFGPLVLGTVKESELCIPSTKTITP
jgi:hypothetical protein